jgi:hypothetical protein
MARRRNGTPKKRSGGNGAVVEYRALGEAYHDACYAMFLKEIESILQRDPAARKRLDRLVHEFREAVFGKLKF